MSNHNQPGQGGMDQKNPNKGGQQGQENFKNNPDRAREAGREGGKHAQSGGRERE